MEDDEAAWAGTLLSGHPTKTPGPPSYRAGKNLACTPPSLLQGKQECTHHSPPGQARPCPKIPKAPLRPVGYSPPGQARPYPRRPSPSSSRASKDARAILFQGRQGHPRPPSSLHHPPTGQPRARSEILTKSPRLLSYRASKAHGPCWYRATKHPSGQRDPRARCRPPRDASPSRRLGPPPACLPWKRRGYPLRTENPPKASRQLGRWVL